MECKKKTFLTKEDAVKRISEIQMEDGNNKKPIRSYKCEKCGLYHLTSWSKNTKKIINNKKIFKELNRIEDEAEYWMDKKGWNEIETNKKYAN